MLASAELYNPGLVSTSSLAIAPAAGVVGTTHIFRGTGFTPNGTATQHIRRPDGGELLGLVLADGAGAIGWSYASRCTDQLGTYTIWVTDDATGIASNTVQETITTSAGCSDNPALPQLFGQRDSNGPIQFGGSTTDTTVTLTGTLSFPSTGRRVKLQTELRRLDEFEGRFTYQATQENELVSFGAVSVTVYGLVPGRYHWQARTVDAGGKSSPWTQAGDNVISASDFTVADVPVARNEPRLNAAGVVNGASFTTQAVAPGTIVSLFGTDLAATTQSAVVLPLPNQLAGTTVTFNQIRAPLLFVSPTQVNLQVPFEISGPTVSIVVSTAGGNSRPLVLSSASTSPGMFTRSQTGKGEVTVVHADFRPVTLGDPAEPAEVVSLFATGLGQVEPSIPSGVPAGAGRLYATVVSPIVLVDGLPAAVTFSGLAPGFVGLYQINFQVPATVARGSAVSVTLVADGRNGNPVTMATSSTDSIPSERLSTLDRIARALGLGGGVAELWLRIRGLGVLYDFFDFVFSTRKTIEVYNKFSDPQYFVDLIDAIWRCPNRSCKLMTAVHGHSTPPPVGWPTAIPPGSPSGPTDHGSP